MATEDVNGWLADTSASDNDKCDIMCLIATVAPFPIAKNIYVNLKNCSDSLSTSETHLILKWLDCNRFLSSLPSWQFLSTEEGKQLEFCIKCIGKESSETGVARYCPESTKIVQDTVSVKGKSRGFGFGGLSIQLNELESILKQVLLFSPRQSSSDKVPFIQESRGVLLYGPPGTGKTLMIRHLTSKYNIPVFAVSASDFSNAAFGEAEMKLQKIFNSAQKVAPSVIFIDEIDSLCPKRDSHISAASVRLTTLLLTLMDGCLSSASASSLLFLGATNAINSLDPALRRPGRFDREIEIPPPNRDDRLSILRALMKSYSAAVITEDELNRIADVCHGFVGADLNLLCKESFLNALIRTRDAPEVSSVGVSFDDFINSLSKVKPSAMREVYIEVPKTKWSDIGGQHETKQKLIECVEWPIKVSLNKSVRKFIFFLSLFFSILTDLSVLASDRPRESFSSVPLGVVRRCWPKPWLLKVD
jgi:SpoVK/Ycf46/Vps4 family AAA+-type ATPase